MKIEELNKQIKECKRCRLYKTRRNAVCGEGNLNAKIMLVAQAPGEKEDEEGRMFVGPSGKVLDELLSKAGVSREKIYMTNLIKCMLPKYRKPKQDEIKACSYYLNEEIKLINPEVLAPLGYYATRCIFEDCKWYPVCPMRRFYEEGKLDKKWIELYCKGDWESCVRYRMEEEGKFHPDYMLPDGSLDEKLRKEIKRNDM